MRSSREQRLIEELKATGDYLEVTSEDKEQLLQQMQYIKTLCKERVKDNERIKVELTELKELLEVTKKEGWQDTLISEIDEALAMLS